jgi:hypothetical protein
MEKVHLRENTKKKKMKIIKKKAEKKIKIIQNIKKLLNQFQTKMKMRKKIKKPKNCVVPRHLEVK